MAMIINKGGVSDQMNKKRSETATGDKDMRDYTDAIPSSKIFWRRTPCTNKLSSHEKRRGEKGKMGLSRHPFIIRTMIALSNEIINALVGPMRSGHRPKHATYFYNTRDYRHNIKSTSWDYLYNVEYECY